MNHCSPASADATMTNSPAVHGIEIIEIVSSAPNGVPLDQLAAIVAARFGKSATFCTCTTQDMTLEGMLALGVLRRKLTIRNGVVFKGKFPICPHCRAIREKREKAQQMLTRQIAV